MGQSAPIETLEDRRLMSISVVSHVLSVVGSPNHPNTIVVGLAPDLIDINVSLSYPQGKTIRTVTKTVPMSYGFRMLSIKGGSQSDSITIDQTNGSFPLLTHITTGNGNDTVTCGDEADLVHCGNGIDAVVSGNGNDSIFAGKGPDTLVGGNGDDQLHTGKGHDMLVAGNGIDTFVDPYGYNTILGGTGPDTFILKNIKLDPDNSYDASKDTLKKYIPPSTSSSNPLNNSLLDGFLGSLLDSYL